MFKEMNLTAFSQIYPDTSVQIKRMCLTYSVNKGASEITGFFYGIPNSYVHQSIGIVEGESRKPFPPRHIRASSNDYAV